MIRQIIDDERLQIIEDQRSVLGELLAIGSELEPEGDSVHDLRKLLEHLDEFFLLVIVGEVKSGKSAFINALLGETVCPEGPTPVTDRIHILKFGPERKEEVVDEYVVERYFPLPVLKNLNIVDTPGTNAIILEHQQITEGFIPKSDLILFVTSIDRPFTESEHQFLAFIKQHWNKRIVFVLTKIDTREEGEVQEVVDFIRDSSKAKLSLDPLVFPVSSKLAKKGKEQGDAEALAASRFEDAEGYILEVLSETEKVALKLDAPTEGALKVSKRLEAEVTTRVKQLHLDFEFLQDLRGQLEERRTDLKERYFKHITLVYDLLREFERRGRAFLQDNLTLSKVSVWRDRKRFQQEFERKVVSDLQHRLEERLHFAADWLTSENLKIWQSSLDFLERHSQRDKYQSRMLGNSSREFDYQRDRLFQSIRERMTGEIERLDTEGECQRISSEFSQALYGFIGVELGAVGLGAILVHLFTLPLLDVTGVALAGAIALTGFVILPTKRNKAIEVFSVKVEELRGQINQMLSEHFNQEIDAFIDRVEDAYQPYQTFYEAETKRLQHYQTRLEELRKRLFAIKSKVT